MTTLLTILGLVGLGMPELMLIALIVLARYLN